METISSPQYIITYDSYKPIKNKKIDKMFRIVMEKVRTQIDLNTYPENLFQLINCIIQIYNERYNVRVNRGDTQNYINNSISLWNNMKKFNILNDFYFDTLSDSIKERNLNYIYEINSIVYDFDTIKVLKQKKQTLINFFVDITNLYRQILLRLDSHKNSHIFSFQTYRKRIIDNLNSNLIEEPYLLKQIENSIEKVRNKNHCRAVLKQCFNQNFGFKVLKPIENSLIYKIDSFLYP